MHWQVMSFFLSEHRFAPNWALISVSSTKQYYQALLGTPSLDHGGEGTSRKKAVVLSFSTTRYSICLVGLPSLVDQSPILLVVYYPKTSVFVYFLHVSAKRVSTIRAKLFQSCLTRCDPMDCTLPGSPVHRILRARILEWVVMPSSKGSFQSRD